MRMLLDSSFRNGLLVKLISGSSCLEQRIGRDKPKLIAKVYLKSER